MKTLYDKLNESLRESYTQKDENINSIIDVVGMLSSDYFTNEADIFEIEKTHTENIIKCQLIFQNKLNDFNSFKEAVNSIINDFNKKITSMGQEEINATCVENNQTNILKLH